MDLPRVSRPKIVVVEKHTLDTVVTEHGHRVLARRQTPAVLVSETDETLTVLWWFLRVETISKRGGPSGPPLAYRVMTCEDALDLGPKLCRSSLLTPVLAWMLLEGFEGVSGRSASEALLEPWLGAEAGSSEKVTRRLRLWRDTELGLALENEFRGCFADRSVALEILCQRARWISENVRSESVRKRMEKSVEILTGMIEDRRGGPMPGRLVSPSDHSVRELMRWLPEENWDWVSGSADPLSGKGKGPHVARALLAHGYEAVPALIEGLEDERFTRCVTLERWTTDDPRPSVLRSGDVALAVIERLSGQRLAPSGERGRTLVFDRTGMGRVPRRLSSRRMVEEGQAARVRRVAQEWWEEVLSIGLKAWLQQRVSEGGLDCTHLATELATRWKDDAFEACMRGARASENADVRAYLIEVAGGLEGDRVTEFLRRALADASARCRVVAARCLTMRGQVSAVDVILHEWAAHAIDRSREAGYVEQMIARNLVGCATVWSLEDVRRQVRSSSLAKRETLLSTLRIHPWPDGGEARIERVLLDLLKDERASSQSSSRPVAKRRLRICDESAAVLSRRWPTRYLFSPDASLRTRDEMIARMLASGER